MTIRHGLVAVAGLLLTLAASPASAATTALAAPPASASITRTLSVRAFTDTAADEAVEAMTLRLSQAGTTVGNANLVHLSGPTSGGRSAWGATLNPLRTPLAGGGALPNGTYRIEVRAVTGPAGEPGEPTEWVGHAVTFAVPPPVVSVTAAEVNDTLGSVEISWTGVTLPDFRRYEVVRTDGAGVPTTIATVADQSTTSTTDVAPGDETFTYQVYVVRADGSDGELSSASEPATVNGGPTAVPSEEEPTPEPTATATTDETATPTAEPTPSTTPPPPPQQGGSGVTVPGSGLPPVQLPTPAPLTAPLPAPLPPGDTFEETLPFEPVDPDDADRDLALQQGSPRESGTLAVLTESSSERRVLVATASGLVLLVLAGHVGRLARR